MGVENASVSTPTKIKEERSCHDILFLILFVGFWVGMFCVAGIGLSEGDPWSLVFGLDYKGNVCGKDNQSPGNMNMENYKYRYWPNVNEVKESTIIGAMAGVRSICLDSCPSPGQNGTIKWVCDYPQDSDPLSRSMEAWAEMKYDYYADLSEEAKSTSLQLQGPCYPVLMKSTSIYWSCQFTGGYADGVESTWESEYEGKELASDKDGAIEDAINDYLTDPVKLMERLVADLGEAWEVVLVCGLLAPLILSLMYLVLMRFCAGCFTWLLVLVVNLLALGLTLYTFVKAGVIGNDAITAVAGEENVAKIEDSSGQSLDASEENKKLLTAMGAVFAVITVLLFLFTIVMITRIKLAIKVLKVASMAVVKNLTVLLVPVLTYLWLVALVLYWLFVAIFLYSSGDIKERVCDSSQLEYSTQCGWELHLDQNLKYMLVYHLFGFLWTIYFIIAFGQMTVAGVIAQYYWSRGNLNALSSSPVTVSLYRAVRYHLGSLAFGAFLLALLDMVILILSKLQKEAESAMRASGNEAAQAMVKCCFKCVMCCVTCFKWILQFINTNAWIVIAVDGGSYCHGCLTAVKIISNNILRLAAINIVGDTLLFLGKVAISCTCGILTYAYLDDPEFTEGDKAISSPLFIVILVMLAAFAVGSVFMSVVEMSVDTIFLSYCIDCDDNNGTAQYGPPQLSKDMEAANAAVAEHEENKKIKVESQDTKV